MKKLLLISILLMVAVSTGLLWRHFFIKQSEQPQQPSVAALTQAPDFSLPNLHGKTIRLRDYRGSAVLLEFWATW